MVLEISIKIPFYISVQTIHYQVRLKKLIMVEPFTSKQCHGYVKHYGLSLGHGTGLFRETGKN